VFRWLTFSNNRRGHSALGHLSPAEYEQRSSTLAAAAWQPVSTTRVEALHHTRDLLAERLLPTARVDTRRLAHLYHHRDLVGQPPAHPLTSARRTHAHVVTASHSQDTPPTRHPAAEWLSSRADAQEMRATAP
jgi:hypothetical protein